MQNGSNGLPKDCFLPSQPKFCYTLTHASASRLHFGGPDFQFGLGRPGCVVDRDLSVNQQPLRREHSVFAERDLENIRVLWAFPCAEISARWTQPRDECRDERIDDRGLYGPWDLIERVTPSVAWRISGDPVSHMMKRPLLVWLAGSSICRSDDLTQHLPCFWCLPVGLPCVHGNRRFLMSPKWGRGCRSTANGGSRWRRQGEFPGEGAWFMALAAKNAPRTFGRSGKGVDDG